MARGDTTVEMLHLQPSCTDYLRISFTTSGRFHFCTVILGSAADRLLASHCSVLTNTALVNKILIYAVLFLSLMILPARLSALEGLCKILFAQRCSKRFLFSLDAKLMMTRTSHVRETGSNTSISVTLKPPA